MADIKTELRELSVLFALNELNNSKHLGDNISFEYFYTSLKHILNNHQLERLHCTHAQFTKNQQILQNGYSIAEALFNVLGLRRIETLKWVGDSPHLMLPADIYIDDIPVSLKEESYILENMGLYRLVSLLTGKVHLRGSLHVFKEFSPQLFQEWFAITWELLHEYLRNNKKWEYKKNNYTSAITLNNGLINFSYKDPYKTLTAVFPISLSFKDYENETTSILREKVFSKWINSTVSRIPEYNTIKHKCSMDAGSKLAELLQANLTLDNLSRFLQVFQESYLYAKSYAGTTEVYRVPNIKEFKKDVRLKEIRCEVPVSQINIYTELVNNETGRIFTLRNEVRYSHGQFNGTPEAKLYYNGNSSLEAIYQRLI